MLTEKQVDEALDKVECGLKRYCWIQDSFWRCDVSKNHNFQTKFNGFYRVRGRDAKWRSYYYELMEKAKTDKITFDKAIRVLKEQTGQIEASFASKLVATLDPDMPVIDKYVLSNFCLRLPRSRTPNREFRVIEVYNDLCKKYKNLLASSEGKMICDKFRRRYPQAQIRDIKKVDLVLWQSRDRKNQTSKSPRIKRRIG